MNIERSKILDKIRALFAKTVEAGCSEAEALSALAKARAMMDAFEVSENNLALTKEEKAILHESEKGNDPHGIQFNLMTAIAEFTDTKAWRRGRVRGEGAGGYAFVFLGLKSDTDLAHYLLAALTRFVQAELADFLVKHDAPRGQRRRAINGFVEGATSRISERLEALVLKSKKVATSNSRALVVVKSAIVAAAIKEHDIHIRSCGSCRVTDAGSIAAGRTAGDRASLGRPIGASAPRGAIGQA
jgi:hypothetical protein